MHGFIPIHGHFYHFCTHAFLDGYTNELHVDPYLLINRGIAASCGHPHLLIEAVADGVRQVNAGVSVASEDSPVQRAQREENKEFKGHFNKETLVL